MLRRLRLPIADPCHENWDAMSGDGPRRFCESCQTQVTNLSEMSEGEAKAFMRAKAGKNVCVRYRSDRGGNIKFKTASVPAFAPTAMSGWRATLAAAGLAAMLLGGCTGERVPDRVDADACTYDMGPFGFQLQRGEGSCPPEDEYEFVMGAVAPEPITPDPVEKMGKVAIEDPPEVMGEAPMVEPEPEIELMGDVAAPGPEPEPEPEPEQGQAAVPCGTEPAAPAPDPTPARPLRY
jgi:hypothetical protein